MKFKYIDSLRGLAILGVIAVHCSQFGTGVLLLPKPFNDVIQAGQYGVTLFFIASSVTLFLSMSHRRNEHRPNVNFFLRRFFRIAPLYYLATLAFQFWAVGPGNPVAYFSPAFFASFFFVHGVRPDWIGQVVPGGWSITVEMTFYLLVPLLFRYVNSVSRCIYLIVFTLFLSSAIRLGILEVLHLDSPEWRAFLELYFINQLPIFGLGIATYHLLMLVDRHAPFKPDGACCLLIAAMLGGYITLGSPYVSSYFAYGLVCSLLLLGLSAHNMPLLVNGVTAYIGRLSYSIYLSHFAVLFIMKSRGVVDYLSVANPITAMLNYGIRYLIVLALAVVLAEISNRTVEQSFQKIVKNIIASLEAHREKALALKVKV